MGAGNGSGGAAAGEMASRIKPFQQYPVVPEELYRQAGYAVHAINGLRVQAQAVQETKVHGVLGRMQVK